MGELLLVLVVVAMLAVPAGLTVVVFVATRALLRGERRPLAGLGLIAGLLVLAAGLAVVLNGPLSLDPQCSSMYAGGRNLEGAAVDQSTGLWPPGLRCRYQFPDGGVESYRADFDGVWVATAMTAVFGAAMGVMVVGRHFSKKRDMLF